MRVLIALNDYASAAKAQLLEKLRGRLLEGGHSVHVHLFDYQDRILRSVPSHSYDMLILMPSSQALLPSDMLRLKAINIPILFLDLASTEGIVSNCIQSDNAQGGAMAAMHLARLGHQKVAVFACGTERQAIKARISGFVRQCALLNIEIINIYDCEIKAGELPAEKMFTLAELAMKKGKGNFSAAFCPSDTAAPGLLHALCNARIKVPDEISVIGFDGISDSAFYNPPLTTIAHDIDAFVDKTLSFIEACSLQNGACQDFKFMIHPKLIERGSTSKVAALRQSLAVNAPAE